MPISSKLKNYLDSNQVKYVSVVHSRAYTAQEVAASVHVRGQVLVKTVMVKMDGENAMLALPASHRVDFQRLQTLLGKRDARLATEAEFKDLFPECEVGAMPPFGNLYGIRVICDASVAQDEEIVFNAGTHTEVIRMKYKDYADLARPEVASFARHL
jgi:Ala-tRNA(Pro) deacylase